MAPKRGRKAEEKVEAEAPEGAKAEETVEEAKPAAKKRSPKKKKVRVCLLISVSVGGKGSGFIHACSGCAGGGGQG
jgi:hypothetical protein